MPMTPTLQIDPTVMTAHWTAGVQNPANAQKLAYKYSHPKAAFNADPAGAQRSYQTGVMDAINRGSYATGMSAADANKAADNMTAYGANAWSAAGTTKAYKFQRKSASLAAALNSVRQTVNALPKGRGANNAARMLAWKNGMEAYKGKITSA
jgi:hypothetical protein